jgi:hypothetical protein
MVAAALAYRQCWAPVPRPSGIGRGQLTERSPRPNASAVAPPAADREGEKELVAPQ